MPLLRQFGSRARALWRVLRHSDRLERELDDELRAYTGMLEDEARAGGREPQEARRRARLALGGFDQVKESVRARRGDRWIGQAIQDARFAVRFFVRTPALAFSAVLTLAIGIGAAAATAVVVHAVVVRPLPYPDAGRLVRLDGVSYAGELLELERRVKTLDAAAYAAMPPVSLTGAGEPVRLDTVRVAGRLFAVLGVPATRGRVLTDADQHPGSERVVLVSESLWRTRLGLQADPVGRLLTLDGVSHRIVGIMPATFAFPDAATDIWLPAIVDPADRMALWSQGGTIVGRLRPGIAVAEAHAEIRALAPAFRTLFPWQMPPDYGTTAAVQPLRDAIVGDSRPVLVVLLGGVTLVWLLACINVGLLLLGRATSRTTELATRAALGATRGRIGRQVFVESALLAGCGGIAAMAVAGAAVTLVRERLALLPRAHEIGVDVRLALAVGALAIVAGVVISAAPVMRAAAGSVAGALGQRGSRQDRGTRRTTRVLVGAEVALAMVLTIGAGLFARSLDRLLDVQPGFARADVVTAEIAPPEPRYEAPAARVAFYAELETRLRALPGVHDVAFTDRLPFGGEPWGSVFVIEGRPNPATEGGEWPWADVRATISPAFFRTLRIPVVEGRAFIPDDESVAEWVAIVDEVLARTYWPGETVVGRRFRFPGMPAGSWIRIVGLVANTKWQQMDEEPRGALYLPRRVDAPVSTSVVLRGTGSLLMLSDALRATVASLDPDTPVDRIAMLEALVSGSAEQPRLLALVFSAFGLTGLLLGALGIYGVAADGVARRRHEIGVRVALGAGVSAIRRLIVRESLGLALAGIAAGIAAALLLSRALDGLLFGVEPTDPLTWAAVGGLLVGIALLSSLLPARRASRVDPLTVLRQ